MDREAEINESKRLLDKNVPRDQPKFSVLRARIASSFVPVFTLSASSARDTMMPQFLVQRLASDAGFSNTTQFSSCIEDKNNTLVEMADNFQAQASEHMMYYSLAQTIPAFLTCLLMGSYTDYVGRRLLIIIPVFTCFIKACITCCIIKFRLDLSFFHLGYGIDGVAGSWYFMLLALFSFTADLSFSKTDRTFWIYFVACTSSIMTAVMNISVGYLIQIYGFFESSLFICSMLFTSLIVVLIFLPETLQERRSIKGVSPLTHLKKIFGFYFMDGTIRRRATFCICMLLFVTVICNDLNIGSLDALYQMHRPFCWDSVQIGDYSAIRTAGGHFFAVMLFKIIQTRVSIERIGTCGVLFQGVAFIFEAFVKHSWEFYLVPAILIPSCTTISIIRTMFSLLAGPDQQGAVFSSVAVTETLCGLVSTQIYNRIYSATVAFMPGTVYLVMASISVIAFSLFVIYLFVHDKPDCQEVVVMEKMDKTDNIQTNT